MHRTWGAGALGQSPQILKLLRSRHLKAISKLSESAEHLPCLAGDLAPLGTSG